MVLRYPNQNYLAWCTLGGARVKYFNLPIGDINSPSYNKFTEGIDFFRQATQTLGKALKSLKFSTFKIHFLYQKSVSDN